MELLTTSEGKEVWLHKMQRPLVLQPPFPGQPYVAIVFSNDASVTDTERESVTRALFESGCRYGLFAGHACGAWEWALDTACIESDPEFQPPDEDFTMTTSHEDQSVEDVMSFGLINTDFGQHEFKRFLVLFIGDRAGLRDEVIKAITSVW